MKQKTSALRIGLFAIAGLVLLIGAVALVSGGKLFARTERAVMNFSGSIYGLQVGAPVVLRGVRIGSVTRIGVVHDAQSGAFAVPVVAEIDRSMIRDAQGQGTSGEPTLTLPVLVQRGLRAQLTTQSLLTGQLYVDLDLNGNKLATAPLADAAGLVEIPTTTVPRQSMQSQLEGIDLRQMAQDLAAITATTRKLLSSPETRQALADLAQTTSTLARTSALLERRIGPLADGTQATLQQAGRAAASLGAAAEKLGNTAQQIGAAAGRAEQLLAPDSPLQASVRQATDELARSAAALRQAAGEDSVLMQNVDGALQEIRRASRAVRGVADLLEQQPEALLRGRKETP